MPAVPSCLLEPAWVEFHALLNERRGGEPLEFTPGHPWGCHRRRIPDRVVFEHVINALVHGSGYERIATSGCSDRTIRRRLAQWAGWGLASELHAAALRAYDQLIGLELGDVAVDGCLTKAPCGGERAGPSPVDRRKGGLKRSLATEGSRPSSQVLPQAPKMSVQVTGMPSLAKMAWTWSLQLVQRRTSLTRYRVSSRSSRTRCGATHASGSRPIRSRSARSAASRSS